MTHVVHPDTRTGISSPARHWLTAALAIVGVAAAAIGAWMAYGPDDSTIQVFNWTWNVADVSELWAPWLMIGGGFFASLGMSWETYKADESVSPWVRALEVLLLIAGFAAMGVGLFLLI